MKKKKLRPVTKVKNLEPKLGSPNWVIWAAWADRITFEEIREKSNFTEAQVIKLMRKELKPSSFRLWRKRVKNKSIKHRRKFELNRKELKRKINKLNYHLQQIYKRLLYITIMKKILMYSGPMCNFCEAAKRLLDRNNLKYEVIDVSSGDGIRDEMIKKSNGKRTIPQIFFDDHHVGGYVELRELEKTGKLEENLK